MFMFNRKEQDYDAIVNIKGSPKYEKIYGNIFFKSYQNGILVTGEIFDLPIRNMCGNSIFALHIHEGNSCTGNENDYFLDAGMHYNPKGCLHPFHAGDLPPIFENDGYAYFSFFTNKFTINEIINRSVIIHSKPDDFTTQPSGNSGEKIACGIIRRR